MSDDLYKLGSTGFQDLAGALCVRSFGPGVQAMGPGRDGGRDLYFRGSLVWARDGEQPGEVWDGYTVFQIKHRQREPERQVDHATWLWGQIKKELDTWGDPKSDRMVVPDYLVIITNVGLTPYPISGGHDRVQKSWDDYFAKLADSSRDLDDGSERLARLARLRRIRAWRFWDETQVQTMLTAYPDVRRGFAGFLTAADVFASLADISDSLQRDQLEPALRVHARTTLIGEGSIYFDEAGSGDATGIPLHEVAIDLPVTVADGEHRTTALRYILDRGERTLRPKITTHVGPRHIVLAGVPQLVGTFGHDQLHRCRSEA